MFDVWSDFKNIAPLPHTYIGNLVHEIRQQARSFDFCSFKPVNRKGNTVAHNLAQLALSSEPNKVWLEDTPPQIASLVISYSFY
jgi:hypothetical protein